MDHPQRTTLPPRSSPAPLLHSHYRIFNLLDQKAAEPEKQMSRQDIIPTPGFCLLVSPGLFFPCSCPSWCQDTNKGLGCIRAYPIWGWMKPSVPQAFLFCLFQVVNIDCWSRAIYLRMHLVNIYVACSWLSVPEQGGE